MNTTNRDDTARDILGAFTVPTLRQLSAAAFAKAICDLDDDEDCVNLVETRKFSHTNDVLLTQNHSAKKLDSIFMF